MSGISTSKYAGASLKKKQERLYQLCHDYLIDNFHKFSEANKLKVALQLSSKMVPQEKSVDMDGQLKVTMMSTIKTETGEELEFNIGSPANSQASGWPRQVVADN